MIRSPRASGGPRPLKEGAATSAPSFSEHGNNYIYRDERSSRPNRREGGAHQISQYPPASLYGQQRAGPQERLQTTHPRQTLDVPTRNAFPRSSSNGTVIGILVEPPVSPLRRAPAQITH
jgi:hypothetical protein